MRKVLITGITGSGGSYLADYIAAETDCKLFGTTRGHNDINHRNLKNVKDKINLSFIDFTDFPSVFEYLDKNRFDYIFHIASIANVRASFDTPTHIIKTNINITLNLLESLRLIKNRDGYNPITSICSSSEVYGNPPADTSPTNEQAPLRPINPYSCSKLFQDCISEVYYKSYGMNIIRTRMFSYLNARRSDLFASHFASQVIKITKGEKEYLEHGSLRSIRSLICADEAAEAYWVAATKGQIGEVYNIGGTEKCSIEYVLNKLISLSGKEIKTKENVNLLRASDIDIQVPDITKFSLKTGWKPRRTLDESIEYFWEEILKN